MKRFKPATIILLSLALQMVVLFWAGSRFVSLVDNDVAFMEQRMAEEGVAQRERQYVSTAMRHMKFDIYHYVQTLGLQLIIVNTATLALLFRSAGKSRRFDDKA